MMLTVACVWVRGNVPYSVEYVARLRAMVARHLTQPFRFVCLTDRPEQVPAGVEAIAIPNPRPCAGWWSKVRLFDVALGLTGRVLYLDLDSLVVASLEPVVAFPSAFALIPDAGTFQPKTHHEVVKRFNSSVMVWDAPGPTEVFATWSSVVADRYWGDQDTIGMLCPDADTFPLEWFPRLSEIKAGPVPAVAIVVLAKKPKPDVGATRWPWVADAWRAS